MGKWWYEVEGIMGLTFLGWALEMLEVLELLCYLLEV